MNEGNLYDLTQIFQNRRFKIPNYQRGYSWEEEHRKELLSDIEHIQETDKGYVHFTGTIVAAKNEDENKPFEIVDGQQRITSLFILLNRLGEQYEDQNNISSGLENFLKKFQIRSKPKRLLILNEETDFYFENALFRGRPSEQKNKSHKNISDAINEFDNWVDDRKDILQTVEIISKNLGFLLYTPPNKKEIGIMFEVINNRGKPLSQLEKIKNYLTYYAQLTVSNEYNLEYEIKQSWRTLLSNLSSARKMSNDDENTFLRYCWIIFQDTNKNKSYHVYKNLKEEFPVKNSDKASRKKLSDFIQFLTDASQHYKWFFKEGDNLHIQRLRFHPQHASIMPLYMAIRHVFHRKEVTDKDLENSLYHLIEILNFRIYVCPEVTKRNDTHQGTLFGYAHRVYDYYFKNEQDEGLSLEDLKKKLKGFIDDHCNIESFVKALTLDKDEKYDYYDWRGLKYFLANYEIYINKQHRNKEFENFFNSKNSEGNERLKTDNFLEKEHLWATKNREEKNNRNKDWHEKRRLGNFTLLESGINSRGDKYGLKEKLKKYLHSDDARTTDLKMNKMLEQVVPKAEEHANQLKDQKYKNWYYYFYRKIFDIREQQLIDFAIKRWGLTEEKNHFVKIDSKTEKNEIFNIQDN